MEESWLLTAEMFLFSRSLFSPCADTCPAKLWSEIKGHNIDALSDLDTKKLNKKYFKILSVIYETY